MREKSGRGRDEWELEVMGGIGSLGEVQWKFLHVMGPEDLLKIVMPNVCCKTV